MALRERLVGNNGTTPPGAVSDGSGQHSFQEMKARLHRTLINRMDLTKLSSLTPEQVHGEGSRLEGAGLAHAAAPVSVVGGAPFWPRKPCRCRFPTGSDSSTTFSMTSSVWDRSSRC